MIIAFCSLILFIFIITDYFIKRHRYEFLKKANVPGNFPLPIIGNVLQIRGLNNQNVFRFFKENVSNKEKMFCFWVFNRLNIVSANVKDLEALLSSNILVEKNFKYDLVTSWLGEGLLTSKGKKWHQRRKIITPTFHFKILEQFVEVFDQQGDVLVEKLSKLSDGKTEIDIFEYICLAALDIITESAMGVMVGAQQNPNFGYTKAVRESTDLFAYRTRSALLVSDLFFKLLDPTNHKILTDNIKFMQSFTQGVIAKRRTILEHQFLANKNKNEDKYDDEDLGTKKRSALLDVLLQATMDGEPLNDEDIREEVETFMFAGHDTTTSGSSFCLYLISRHPEVQQRLFQEIRDVIGDDKQRPVFLRDLQELKYLECVIKETLRMFPPVPVIGRYFPNDAELNGKLFPAGTNFSIDIYDVLNDPDNFKDPHKFDPERFSSGKINPFTYIPFSAGSRNCVGQKYAMLEMKSMISKILRHYELVPLGPEPILSITIVLKSRTGVNLGLRPRIY